MSPALSAGRVNVGGGLLALAGFMGMGFVLIYLRDFAPGKEQWIAEYGIGKHFETRLAHVHGTLFAVLNVALGFVLARVRGFPRARTVSAVLALVGLLMPAGILAEVLFGAPPIFVLLGAIAMVASVATAGVLAFKAFDGGPAPA